MDPRQRAKANRGKLVLLVALLLTAISLLARNASSSGDSVDGFTGGSGGVFVDTTPLPPDRDRLFGGPLRRVQLDGVPFEPDAYARYYPECANCTTDQLRLHYQRKGKREHYVPGRLRVVLDLELAEPGAGLANQLYGLVAMLALGLETGCEIVLPPAHRRNGTYAIRYTEGLTWQTEPLQTLLDVPHLVAWAQRKGAIMHAAAPSLPVNTLTVDLNGTELGRGTPMARLAAVLRRAALNATEAALQSGKASPVALPGAVVVRVVGPLVLFSLHTAAPSHVGLVTEIVENLRPPRHVASLAERIVANLTADGGAFNGLHLRIEDDTDWVDGSGGTDVFWAAYFSAMRQVGFEAETPVYVASGLLTYMDDAGFRDRVEKPMMERDPRLCSGLIWKELFLQPEELNGLHSEALALVDMLVLIQSRKFVGFDMSTLSWYIREKRCLRGVPLSDAAMTKGFWGQEWIDLFDKATRLSDYSRCPDPVAEAA